MTLMTKIINANIVTHDGIINGELLIKDGIIEKVSENVNCKEEVFIFDAKNKYLLPGFIDVHTNGSAGFDCTFGKYNNKNNSFYCDEENYLSGLNNALKNYLQSGCTKIVLSTISAPLEQIKQSCEFIKKFKLGNPLLREVIFGLMIEGSFIKEETNGGAHNPKYFQSPSQNILNELISGNEELIKIINIPPEWGEDSNNAYKFLKQKNIIPAAGHTSATANEINKAISSGLKLGIHLFNGPSFSSYKPFNGGGAVEALLKSENTFVEIIVDGLHVDKSYFMDALKRKGEDKVIAITDNMFVTGSEIKNEFTMGEKVGMVSEDSKYLYIKEKPNALFGSNLKMNDAFENLLNWFTSDIEGVWNKIHKAKGFEKALVLSSKLCSENPAELLGISKLYGTVSEGKKADLLLADINFDKKYNFRIEEIILNGKFINNLETL